MKTLVILSAIAVSAAFASPSLAAHRTPDISAAPQHPAVAARTREVKLGPLSFGSVKTGDESTRWLQVTPKRGSGIRLEAHAESTQHANGSSKRTRLGATTQDREVTVLFAKSRTHDGFNSKTRIVTDRRYDRDTQSRQQTERTKTTERQGDVKAVDHNVETERRDAGGKTSFTLAENRTVRAKDGRNLTYTFNSTGEASGNENYAQVITETARTSRNGAPVFEERRIVHGSDGERSTVSLQRAGQRPKWVGHHPYSAKGTFINQ
jgi:hypothetical protein